MPSPITPSQLQALIPTASGSTCDKLIRVLFTLPSRLVDWYQYVYNEDGTFTDAFKADLCSINCATVTGGGGSFAAPTLSWAGILADRVRLNWNAISGAAYYELMRSTTPNPLTAVLIKETTLLTFDDTTATPDTWYFYWIRARTATTLGSFSPYLEAYASASPPLGLSTPTIVTTTNIPDYVACSWAAIAGATTYEVRRNTSNNFAAATILGTTAQLFFADFGGGLGTSYYYFVRAFNSYVTPGPNSTGVIGVRT